MNRRTFLASSAPIIATLPFLSKPASAATAGSGADPEAVLKELRSGNERLVRGKTLHPRAGSARIVETARNGQKPHTVVLSCADSRVPPEIVFDQGIGDLFVVRVAGNVANNDEIASLEYAIEHFKSPVCVVLGHSACGAVQAVVNGDAVPPEIQRLVAPIGGAKDKALRTNPGLKGSDLVAATVRANVLESIEYLFRDGPIVREHAKGKELTVVGAVYDIATGKVDWLGSHPNQAALL